MIRPPKAPQWRRIATPIALAAVSLFAALILWIAVSDAENPQTEVEVKNVTVRAVNVPDDLAVRNINPSAVSLFVRVDEDDGDSLAPADFEVTVDLINVRETADMEIRYRSLVQDVEVIVASQQTVRVELEQLVSKQVPVEPNPVGNIPQGYSYRPEISPSTATVRGARTLVDRVTSVTADLNLTGLRANLTQEVALVSRDSRGLEIPRVQIDPQRAEVRIAVQQQETTVQLPVVASLQGALADGYTIASVTVDPPLATVIGTLETTQALTSVSTEPIELSGLKSDVVRSVRLRLPNGVKATRDTVSVNVRIAPAQGELLLSVAPRITNVGDGLTATLQTATITLYLSGEMPALKSITPGMVSATVSAANLQEGIHPVEPQISNLPANVQVKTMEPPQVVVVIKR